MPVVTEAPPDYSKYLSYAFVQRPLEERPLLVVLGDSVHFSSSALAKTKKKTQLLQSKHISEATDDELQRERTRFIKWAPGSIYQITPEERNRVPNNKSIINDTHFHCRKANVQDVFEKVFRYPLKLDHLNDTGQAVVKTNGNANHDGKIITLPDTEIRDNVVYERLINNEIGRKLTYDIRLPLIGDISPFAVVKIRPKSKRFQNRNLVSFLVTTSYVLSSEEMFLCRQFCKQIGLQFGELDVLRDKESQKIYIVDANNTPVGPTMSLSAAHRLQAIQLYGEAFSKAFFGTHY